MADRKNCPLRHENGNCWVIGGFCTAVNNEICTGLHNAYEKGRSDGVVLPTWIPVTERLPKFYKNEKGMESTRGKLVFYSDWDKTVHIGYCIKDVWYDIASEAVVTFYRWYDDRGAQWEDISHWMPLPAPLKDGDT